MSTATLGGSESDSGKRVLHYLQHRLQEVRSKVADQVLLASAIAGFFLLLSSLSRVSEGGWRSLLYIHVAAFLMVLTTTLLRGRLSLSVKVAVLIALGLGLGIAGMLTWGLVAGGYDCFVAASLLAGLLLNWKYGSLTLLFGLAFLSIEALAVQKSLWSFDVDVEAYSLDSASWAVAIVATGFFATILLVAQQRVHRALFDALLKISDLVSRLEAANAKLKNEMDERIAAEKREQELHDRLDTALTKVLSGFVTICASCKSIRDEGNEWVSVERYVEAHTDTQFSHTICDRCITTLYPDIDTDD